MRETKTGDRQIIEHTSPLWRILGVVFMVGGVGALGWWARDIGYIDQFATIFVVAALFSVGFWARQRPDRLRKRLGSFGLIADAVRKSGDQIRADVYARPLRFGVIIGVLYGGVVVAAKALVVTLLTSLVAWPLAVGVAGIVAALVAAPDLFSGVARRMSVEDEDEDLEEPEPEEDDLARRRAAGEE